jgi:MarR family transcriptional regulator, organic hydroperoxide resistance regulator
VDPPRRSLVIELQRATHAVGVRLEAELASAGISQGEAHVLSLLADRKRHPVGELQRHLLHRPSTLTGLLDRLELRGWITRTVNPDDRRSYLVSATVSGRRAAAAVTRANSAIEREVTGALSVRDVDGFLAVAGALSGESAPSRVRDGIEAPDG